MNRISPKQYVVGTVAVVAIFFLLFGSQTLPQYRTTNLVRGEVKKEIDFTTNWYPVGYANVSLGNSLDIRKIVVKEGATVSKNTMLAQLNDESEYNQFKTAQASYYAAIKARNSAKANPLTPSSTLDTLQGQINTSYYQMKNAEVALNRKKLKSPIAGKVISIQVSDYSNSSAGSALGAAGATSSGNFIVIANNKDASLNATVSSTDVARLATDMKVTFTAKGVDTVLTGKVDKISKTPVTIGAEDPTYQITIKLDAYPSTHFGIKLDGAVVTAQKSDALIIQYDAITLDSVTKGSVLVLKNGVVTTVTVEVGTVGDDAVEVTGGLSETDSVVVDKLADKKIITLRPWIKNLLRLK